MGRDVPTALVRACLASTTQPPSTTIPAASAHRGPRTAHSEYEKVNNCMHHHARGRPQRSGVRVQGQEGMTAARCRLRLFPSSCASSASGSLRFKPSCFIIRTAVGTTTVTTQRGSCRAPCSNQVAASSIIGARRLLPCRHVRRHESVLGNGLFVQRRTCTMYVVRRTSCSRNFSRNKLVAQA